MSDPQLIVLPAAYVDNVEEVAAVEVVVINETPERDSIGAAKSTNVRFTVLSTTGFDIDTSSRKVFVGGTLAYDDGAGGAQPGFSVFIAVLSASEHDFTINPTTDFVSEQVVAVRCIFEDLDSPSTAIDFTYSFTVEDTTQPRLSQVKATGPDVVRVTFDEGMKSTSSVGVDDALNPANYQLVFVPVNDRQAGVSANVLTVSKVSSSIFDLMLDIELSFGRTYNLMVEDMVDDSVGGNEVDPAFDEKQFVSWTPPVTPADRDFSLFRMMSAADRRRDASGDLERLMSAIDDTISVLCWDSDRFSEIWDIDDGPIQFIEALLQDFGNPFEFDLTDNRKRKLMDLLVEIYRQKGTERGIINLARFFLGIEITDITAYNEDTWVLGESELGIDTVLATGAQAAAYTFVVNLDTNLTALEERQLRQLIDYMKPVHTHYIIVQPADAEFIDHLELGISDLGENWTLH